MPGPANVAALAEALKEFSGVRVLGDRRALGGHHAFRLLRAERVEEFRGDELCAVAERKLLDPGGVEGAHDANTVVEGGRAEEDEVGIGVADPERDRNRVGERRRPHPIDDDLHVVLRQHLGETLEVSDRSGGIVADERGGADDLAELRPFALEQLCSRTHLEIGTAAVAESVLVTALHQYVAVAESEHWHLEPLPDLARGEREGAEEAAAEGSELASAQQPLRSVGGGLDPRPGVGDPEVDLGAAERFDAALAVNLLARHFGADAHQLAVLGPRAAEWPEKADVDRALRRRTCDPDRKSCCNTRCKNAKALVDVDHVNSLP